MPTPATGLITWAASPISNRPGLCHVGQRLDSTESSETFRQSVRCSTRLENSGMSSANCRLSSPIPSCLSSGKLPLGITYPACQWSSRSSITAMCPLPNRPTKPSASPGSRGSLNQSTSIGGDRQRCPDLVPPALVLVARASHRAVFFDEFLYPRAHHEPEARVLLRLPDDELQEARLRHDRDVRELRIQPREVRGGERSVRGLQGEAVDLAVAQ